MDTVDYIAQGALGALSGSIGQAQRELTPDELEKMRAEKEAYAKKEKIRAQTMAVCRLAEKFLIADLGKTMTVEECFSMAENFAKQIQLKLDTFENKENCKETDCN